jgi:hypothetical protein
MIVEFNIFFIFFIFFNNNNNNKMGSKIIYIQPNQNIPDEQDNIIGLVQSIDTNKNALEAKYNTKLKIIQDAFYRHRLDDEALKMYLDNEIKAKAAKDAVYYQNARLNNVKKMQDVNALITDLRTQQSNLITDYSSYNTIKSLEGQHLAVSNVPNTTDYMIHVNNKCVSVSNKKNYSLQECNNNRMSQRFTIESINDNASYLAQFNIRAPPTEIVSYPYNLVKSKLTGLCLEENKGELTLNNCISLDGQKWKGMTSGVKTCRTN